MLIDDNAHIINQERRICADCARWLLEQFAMERGPMIDDL